MSRIPTETQTATHTAPPTTLVFPVICQHTLTLFNSGSAVCHPSFFFFFSFLKTRLRHSSEFKEKVNETEKKCPFFFVTLIHVLRD